jgi:hypothetical protein
MINFIIVWQESDGHVEVHRYSTDNDPVIAMIRRCAGQFIYHQNTDDFDTQENEVESLGTSLEERAAMVDHGTIDPVKIFGSYELILTGYYLGQSKRS